MSFTTADLCDHYSTTDHIQIVEPIFKDFGGVAAFSGQITTLKVFEDDVLVERALQEPGANRVLVIDGGGSHRCALLDAAMARLAQSNGWQGIIVYGCVRNSSQLRLLSIGIRALHPHPHKSHKRGLGDRDTLITLAGVNFKKNHYLYADEDGIIVSEAMLG